MLAFFPLLLTLHSLSSMLFFLAYAVFVALALRLHKAANFDGMTTLLDLASISLKIGLGSFFVMGLTGLIMPFLLDIWSKGWVRLSVVLMLVVFAQMVFMNERRFKNLRQLVASPDGQGVIEMQMKQLNLIGLVIGGYVIPLVVLWLMLVKPF